MADPITREQVERLLAAARAYIAGGAPFANDPLSKTLDAARDAVVEHEPNYVRAAWEVGDVAPVIAALTRWRDELAAAEPVRRVARWDAERGAYVALDDHGAVCMVASDRETAIGWGYDVIEPESLLERARARVSLSPHAEMTAPAPAEDSPERLRERRVALGLSRRSMADLVPHTSICMDNVPEYATHWHPEDIRRCEEVPDAPAIYAQHRARYAAALSAEEALRAAKAHSEAVFGTAKEPERPAPRFKVGDWVRVKESAVVYQVGEVADVFGAGRLFYRSVGWLDGSDPTNSWQAEALEPASPPAPEVVDVPQPETWHARLVRLALALEAATRAHEDAKEAFGLAQREVTDAAEDRMRAIGEFDEATRCSSILAAAQQGGAS